MRSARKEPPNVVHDRVGAFLRSSYGTGHAAGVDTGIQPMTEAASPSRKVTAGDRTVPAFMSITSGRRLRSFWISVGPVPPSPDAASVAWARPGSRVRVVNEAVVEMGFLLFLPSDHRYRRRQRIDEPRDDDAPPSAVSLPCQADLLRSDRWMAASGRSLVQSFVMGAG